MSYDNCWAALNMKFAPKVPRTEYSAHCYHWDLIKAVSGIDTSVESNRPAAQQAFLKAWDYGFMWSVMVARNYLDEKGGRTTSMGHAEYANNGADFNDQIRTPFVDVEDAYALDPVKEYGVFDQDELVRRFEAHYAANQKVFPGMVTMSGTYITMFSGLIEIFGWDAMLMAMGTEPERFGKVVEGYAEWVGQFFDAYAKTSIPVMMVHDDLCWTSGPVTSPDWYRQHIFPHIAKNIRKVKEAGKLVIFTSDGTIDAFFDDIVALGVDSVVMEPSSDMAAFAAKHGDKVGFVGGMDCRTLTYGGREDIKREMERIMAWKRYPGFILATGNHLPANVPVDNALYYNELYERLAWR